MWCRGKRVGGHYAFLVRVVTNYFNFGIYWNARFPVVRGAWPHDDDPPPDRRRRAAGRAGLRRGGDRGAPGVAEPRERGTGV